jgi:hypothetical protein
VTADNNLDPRKERASNMEKKTQKTKPALFVDLLHAILTNAVKTNKPAASGSL